MDTDNGVHVHSGIFINHKEVENNASPASGKKIEMIIPSEVRETRKDKYHMIPVQLLSRV